MNDTSKFLLLRSCVSDILLASHNSLIAVAVYSTHTGTISILTVPYSPRGQVYYLENMGHMRVIDAKFKFKQ